MSYVRIPDAIVSLAIGSGSLNPSTDAFFSTIFEYLSFPFCMFSLILKSICHGESVGSTEMVSEVILIPYFSLYSLFLKIYTEIYKFILKVCLDDFTHKRITFFKKVQNL